MPPSPPIPHRPAAREFFQADLISGALLRDNGSRCAALPVDFVQSIHLALFEQFRETAQDVLYRIGFEWGLQEMLRVNQHVRNDDGSGKIAPWDMDPNLVFEEWWQPLRETGWGAATLDFSHLARGVVVAEVRQSIVASALGRTDRPVCHCYAGLFSGGLSFFERAERHATEMQCRAMGHPSCKFIIGPGADVDAAEMARKQGVAAIDIIRRIG